MRKALCFAMVLFFVFTTYSCFSQNFRDVYLNGEKISYILVDNEVCLTAQELQRLALPVNTSQLYSVQAENGVYYYPLKQICNQIGLVSATKTDTTLNVVINIAKLTITIWSNDAKVDKSLPITVYVLNSKNLYVEKYTTYVGQTNTFFVTPDIYTVQTDSFINYSQYSDQNSYDPSYCTTQKTNYEFYWKKQVNAQAGTNTPVDLNDDCLIREYPEQ